MLGVKKPKRSQFVSSFPLFGVLYLFESCSYRQQELVNAFANSLMGTGTHFDFHLFPDVRENLKSWKRAMD